MYLALPASVVCAHWACCAYCHPEGTALANMLPTISMACREGICENLHNTTHQLEAVDRKAPQHCLHGEEHLEQSALASS